MYQGDSGDPELIEIRINADFEPSTSYNHRQDEEEDVISESSFYHKNSCCFRYKGNFSHPKFHRFAGYLHLCAGSVAIVLEVVWLSIQRNYVIFGSGVFGGLFLIIAGVLFVLAVMRTSKDALVAAFVMEILSVLLVGTGVILNALELEVHQVSASNCFKEACFLVAKCSILIMIFAVESILIVVHLSFTCSEMCFWCRKKKPMVTSNGVDNPTIMESEIDEGETVPPFIITPPPPDPVVIGPHLHPPEEEETFPGYGNHLAVGSLPSHRGSISQLSSNYVSSSSDEEQEDDRITLPRYSDFLESQRNSITNLVEDDLEDDILGQSFDGKFATRRQSSRKDKKKNEIREEVEMDMRRSHFSSQDDQDDLQDDLQDDGSRNVNIKFDAPEIVADSISQESEHASSCSSFHSDDEEVENISEGDY